jgi:hypothetical protein
MMQSVSRGNQAIGTSSGLNLCALCRTEEDWRSESVKIASAYGNANLTIFAKASKYSSYGIPDAANRDQGKNFRLPCRISYYPLDYIWLKPIPGLSPPDFHLGDRVWTLQDSLLSPRLVVDSASQLLWICRTASRYEGGLGCHLPMGVGSAVADPKKTRLLSLVVQPSPEFGRRSTDLETRHITFETLQNEARL